MSPRMWSKAPSCQRSHASPAMAESLSDKACADDYPRELATSARLSIRQSSTIKYRPPTFRGCRSNRSSGTVQKRARPKHASPSPPMVWSSGPKARSCATIARQSLSCSQFPVPAITPAMAVMRYSAIQLEPDPLRFIGAALAAIGVTRVVYVLCRAGIDASQHRGCPRDSLRLVVLHSCHSHDWPVQELQT